MSIALASILQSYEEALLIRSRIVGSVRVIVCGSATCLCHLSRIVPRGVVCVEYAPRKHWQSPCPVVIVVGCSWFVKTVPVVQYAFVASVKSVCQALLCIRLWLDGTSQTSVLRRDHLQQMTVIPIRNISPLNRENFPFKLPGGTGRSLMTRECLSSYPLDRSSDSCQSSAVRTSHIERAALSF